MKNLIPILVILAICLNSNAQFRENDIAFFEKNNMMVSASVTRYDVDHSNSVVNRIKIPLRKDITEISTADSRWKIITNINSNDFNPGTFDISMTFKCLSGNSPSTSVSLNLGFSKWSQANYVLMPAAVYNGNRVKSQRHLYCPFWFDISDIGIDKAQLISDVPRLNINEGPSRIQQRSGDMSTPAIGFRDPLSLQGFWLLTEQETRIGDTGIDIEENDDRSQAEISLTAPVVREKYRYFIADMQWPSTDQPAYFKEGDSITIKAKIYFFSAPNTQSLFDYFAGIRKNMIPKGKTQNVIPFSTAFSIQENKFNRQNFVSEFGYYSVGLRENYYADWQIGWTGGMISTYPLLLDGSEISRKNVARNFDWIFANGISPSGYFWDSGQKGNQWFGIFQSSPYMKDWHLVRKSADGLYYILKQFYAFKQLGIEVKPEWEEGARKVGDTFVKTWKIYGQLGNYVNNTSGEIVIGGSTSAGIMPGVFALMADYFDEPAYLKVAEEIAEDYVKKYISKGLIYGGPGDALQNFDSESSYALLEAFTVLYDQTKDPHWLKIAEDVSNQFLTWVSSYDYRFPQLSTLGRLGKTTTGVVWANTQNKHGAPGICTHSGLALLRLYRATGKKEYLIRLQEITKAIPQYLSTKENPIPGLESGWISERVSTTDWLEGIGELFSGSTWAETSLMLTYSEIPGIYVDPGKGICIAFDQVDSKIIKDINGIMEIEIYNPTKYPASVKVFKDDVVQRPLMNNYLYNCKIVKLKSGEVLTIEI